MKNISLILNVVLLIAVAVLFFLHFSGSQANASDTESADSVSVDVSNLKIAYVNTDSLVANYDFFIEKSEELNLEKQKSEADLGNRAQGIEKQIRDFQQTQGNMTINQARAIEEDLVKRQQNLMQYRETLTQNLIRKENEINNELYEKISSYLKTYGEDNDLEVVLSYSRGSGVLYANGGLDITQVVIKGLNDAYRNPSLTPADSTQVN